MKILIAADMEGVSGVTAWDQVIPGKPDYSHFCRIMTEDVNAAVSGYFDVPVIMVTGDQTACAQTVELLGEIETTVVKRASGRYSAECLPSKISQDMIQKTAEKAISKLAKRSTYLPFVLEEPILLSVEFFTSDMADRAITFPGVEREGTCITISTPDMLVAYSAFRALVSLAKEG